MPGPIFANIVLADEINRTPPKTQAALLEAMQERQVTAGANTFDLEPPSSSWPPRTRSSRKGPTRCPRPSSTGSCSRSTSATRRREEERRIVNATTQSAQAEVKPILSGRDLLWIQQLVRKVPVTDHVVDYAVDLVRATRPKEPGAPTSSANWLTWGAGPRAGQYLVLAAKARAILHGRLAVSADDIRAVARPVLRHRIVTNFNADAEGVDTDQIIDKLLQTVPEPSYGEPGTEGDGTARRGTSGRPK